MRPIQYDIDHIVVGTGGKGGVARLVLGSVSSDVIARAHCPANGQRRPFRRVLL